MRHWVADGATVATSEKSIADKALDHFHAVDFDALLALARGIANALFRLQSLHTRAPQRAGVDVDVPGSRVRHDEAKALLVVEELDLALDHRSRRAGIALAMTAAAEASAAAATEA